MKADDYDRVKLFRECIRGAPTGVITWPDFDWIVALDNRRNLQGANFTMSKIERERFESIEKRMR